MFPSLKSAKNQNLRVCSIFSDLKKKRFENYLILFLDSIFLQRSKNRFFVEISVTFSSMETNTFLAVLSYEI